MAELFIPQPQDNITPAMNLYKLMQQKKEYELDLAKQGSLQDYHRQLGLQGRMQNIISLAKDQPEAAAQMFNSDPELMKMNGGRTVKFLRSDDEFNFFEDNTGNVTGIGKKTGRIQNFGQVGKTAKQNVTQYLYQDQSGKYRIGLFDESGNLVEDQGEAPERMTRNPLPSEQKVILAEETAEAKEVGKGRGEDFGRAMKASEDAQARIDKLDRAMQLLEDVSTGKLTPLGTEIARYTESVGIKIDPNVGNKQAAESLMKEFALQLRNPQAGGGMPGQMSDTDREYLKSIPPGIEKTPEGNRLIFESLRKLALRQIEYADQMEEYRDKHGTLDGFRRQWRKYVDSNPLFKDVDSGILPKGIPSGSKQIGTKDGKPVYQTPDGKRLVVE